MIAAALLFIALPVELRSHVFELGFADRLKAALKPQPAGIVFLTLPVEDPAWVESIRQQPDETAARLQYVEFLKERWGYNIERLAAAYRLSASSFTDLYSIDWRTLDHKLPAVRDDDRAFSQILRNTLLAALQESAAPALISCGEGKLACKPDGSVAGEVVGKQLFLPHRQK